MTAYSILRGHLGEMTVSILTKKIKFSKQLSSFQTDFYKNLPWKESWVFPLSSSELRG